MPIPILVAGVIATAAGKCVAKKICDAKDTMAATEAKNELSKKLFESSQRRLQRAKVSVTKNIEMLGKVKLDVLTGNIAKFVDVFGKMKNVQLNESIGIDQLKEIDCKTDWFAGLAQASSTAKNVVIGLVGGSALGTLLSAGAFGLVHSGVLGTLVASTGTAISGLTGAAATNATLAWLGGGSLAAGGFGMAGGMVVLGGLVTIPMLAVMGLYMSSKIDEAYSQACAYYDKSREFDEQTRNIVIALKAIEMRSCQICGILRKLNGYMTGANNALAAIVQKSGPDYRLFSVEEKKIVGMSAQLAKVIKIILDTSLLNESGELTAESIQCIDESKKYLKKWE